MPTERDRITHITHGDLALHNPVAPAKLDETLDRVDLRPGDRVVDIGCGQGEVLIRLLERHSSLGLSAIGNDLSEPAILAGRERAARRVPDADLDLRCEDASATPLEAGSFGLAICIGSSHALGGLEPMMERLGELVRPGGFVLVGDGYWRADPPDAYLEALGGATRDELPELSGLQAAGEAAGLRPVWTITSSEDDWDRYEWSLIANGERWAFEHPGDELTAPLLAWVDRARRRYTGEGGRSSLGFALVLFRRPADRAGSEA